MGLSEQSGCRVVTDTGGVHAAACKLRSGLLSDGKQGSCLQNYSKAGTHPA